MKRAWLRVLRRFARQPRNQAEEAIGVSLPSRGRKAALRQTPSLL